MAVATSLLLSTPGISHAQDMAHLQNDYGVPRYWVRTLTTHYMKKKQEQ